MLRGLIPGPKRPVRGKVVLITGAARGLGAGVATALAARGATLALVGLEPDELGRVAAECGPNAGVWEADVTDRAAMQRVTHEIAERYGRIDVVLANAGIAAAGFCRTMDEDAFDRVIEVDLLGVWRTVRAALPHVISSKGYVLIISSMAAVVHIPGNAPYNTAKAGVEAFGNTLRAEVAHFGVGVGVAHPTWIATDMVSSADEHPVFGPLRSGSLGPLGKTYPLAFAVDCLVAGIQRRARAVHIPRNLLGAKLVRAFIPPLLELGGRRFIPGADADAAADVEARGAPASAPVGPGGRAAVER
jgi:NAD(P)-dependent dehydrogenase (short-subunit alcohol dehydrogenase family)